ncbi:MAG: MotA/TolQ/ExbB proton channel family protein [Oligoflexia bacterium]|nr:MotA/TolQ/ExbB proton channel family protein [Oligoflexia bacterium]
MEAFATIAEAFRSGGIWMWLIFMAQVVSLAIIAERVMALYLSRKGGQRRIAKQFEEDIRKGNLEKVITRSQNLGGSDPIGKVIQAGSQAALDLGGREEIQARMDEVLLAENTRNEKRIGFLAMMGNVGTLLGLLGTIIGMIESFSSVSSANPVEKATMLSHGISIAMHATAYGLIVAIPALVMYSVLQNRANMLSEDLNQGALMAFNWLSFSSDSISGRKTKSK